MTCLYRRLYAHRMPLYIHIYRILYSSVEFSWITFVVLWFPCYDWNEVHMTTYHILYYTHTLCILRRKRTVGAGGESVWYVMSPTNPIPKTWYANGNISSLYQFNILHIWIQKLVWEDILVDSGVIAPQLQITVKQRKILTTVTLVSLSCDQDTK